MPIHKSNLDKTGETEKSLPAFLFEPKDFVPYLEAWEWQQGWQELLIRQPSSNQAIWMLQHQPCYTLGRGATTNNLLFDPAQPPADLYRVNRGGEVTHHMPGQLVVYLILDLRRYQMDLNWYLRQLELSLIDVLALLGIEGRTINGLTGLWVEGFKVGAIGVGCRRWITQHGLALNIDCDLKGFEKIIPCGLSTHSVGKLSNWIPGLTIKEVKPLMQKCLIERFRLDLQKRDNFRAC